MAGDSVEITWPASRIAGSVVVRASDAYPFPRCSGATATDPMPPIGTDRPPNHWANGMTRTMATSSGPTKTPCTSSGRTWVIQPSRWSGRLLNAILSSSHASASSPSSRNVRTTTSMSKGR